MEAVKMKNQSKTEMLRPVNGLSTLMVVKLKKNHLMMKIKH
jgi:hypothetical protein